MLDFLQDVIAGKEWIVRRERSERGFVTIGLTRQNAVNSAWGTVKSRKASGVSVPCMSALARIETSKASRGSSQIYQA